MKMINIKEYLKAKDILTILAQSTYMPTEEKLNTRAQRYMDDDRVIALGANIDDKFCGIVILNYVESYRVEILDIAILKERQHQGIGHQMIKCIKEFYKPACILAETDDDAVGFYRKIGFEVNSLGEKYPGIIRYECKYTCE